MDFAKLDALIENSREDMIRTLRGWIAIPSVSARSDAAGAPVSLVFVGEKLYAAVERRGMFVPVLDEPVGVQKERLGGDIAVLRKAAELLIDLPE